MCWRTTNKCKRTKTVCDDPECLASWHQNEARLMYEATTTYSSIIDEMFRSTPEGETVH